MTPKPLMAQKAHPVPTLKRLPLYLRFLKGLDLRNRTVVSCTHIAEDLRMDSTQVRKDLSITGINGKPRVGYQVAELIQAIEEFLGWRNATDAFLVGAGHLGAALLGFDRFPDLGLRIVAAFDTDPAKIGAVIHGKEVLSMEKLPDLAFRMHIHIGVLTVPARAAQESTDILIGSGIRAIWNFTAARLDAPDDCVVENVDLSSSFAVLSARLRTILKE